MAWGVPKQGSTVEVASGNITLNEDALVAEGDLLIAILGYRGSAPFTVPSGWTLVEQESLGDTDATGGIASGVMAWIIRGASAPDLTFTRTGGDVARGRTVAYTGGHASAPFDVSSSNTLASTSTSVTAPGFTTAEDGELLVAMSVMGDATGALGFDAATDPAVASGVTQTGAAPQNGEWKERLDTTSATGADIGVAFADAVKETAGATGQFSVTAGANGRHVMIVAAFKQSASAVNISGSGAPVATLSAFASGTARLIVIASGSPVATLSAFASGSATATETLSGSGAAVATLSAFASGAARLVIIASGSPVATLSAFASGTASSSADVVGSGTAFATLVAYASGVAFVHVVERPRAKGGGVVLIHPDAPRKPRRKKRKRPVPHVEAAPLAELEQAELPAPRTLTLDPETWARVMLRIQLPVSPPVEPEPEPQVSTTPVEDRLMQFFLATLGGEPQLPPLNEEEAPYLLMRFLRMGQ